MTTQRNKLIQEIHAKARDHKIDDETRREMMLRLVGKSSCSDMSDNQLRIVANGIGGGKAKQAYGHVRKVRALWLSAWNLGIIANKSHQALDAFVERQTDIDQLVWLPPTKAHAVIDALKGMITREAKVDFPSTRGLDGEIDAIIRAQLIMLTDGTSSYVHQAYVDTGPVASAARPEGSWQSLNSKQKNQLIKDLGVQVRLLKKEK